MGLERLLCGTLECYSRQFLLVNIRQTVRGIRNASSPGSNVSKGVTFPGLFSGIFIHTSRQLTARRNLCTSVQPSRDVTLFEHDKTRFFRLLTVFCGGQFIFWTYLAHFAYTGLRDTGGTAENEKAKAATTTMGLGGMWSFEMNLGSNTWRYGFTLGCLTIGAGIVGLGALLFRQSVSKVVLHQGGKIVTVCTQSLLGTDQARRITVPLSQVACYAHRLESPTFIPLKVKGHKFFFLLDKAGTVNNARMFDITVGAYRQV